MISPFKTKAESMEAYKKVRLVHLRCLKDGSLREFKDDGPFDKPHATPHSGRSNLLHQLSKRVPDPIRPNEEIPVYVLDEKADSFKVFDRRLGMEVSPQRMTDHFRKCMEAFVAQRNQIDIRAQEAIKAKQADEEAKTQAGLNKLIAALGDSVAKAKPAAAKPAGGAA